MASRSTIPVTFDKSHLTTIGRRLYSESLDLVRELVANSYDADATTVRIEASENRLSVDDNGNGMNRQGLIQYFTIGSQYKRSNPLSPRYKRPRIGEFGIGKFAVLALCDRFELFTRSDGYAATVIFDKSDFEKGSSWEVPVVEHGQTYVTSGTTVTLHSLKRPVMVLELERELRQQLPLAEKNFSVFLNSARLTPSYIPGRRFRIIANSSFGPIRGEIVIASLLVAKEDIGIAVKVKGMTIRRLFFGLDKAKLLAPKRISGEIRADFDLPLFSPETEKQKAVQEAVGEGVFTKRMAKRKGALAKSAKLKGSVSRKLKKETRNRVRTILKDQNRLIKKLKIGGVKCQYCL